MALSQVVEKNTRDSVNWHDSVCQWPGKTEKLIKKLPKNIAVKIFLKLN